MLRKTLIVFFAIPSIVFAETAYVTDKLRLGLHQAADTSDRAFQTLESGHQVEILSRNRNYAHVTLPDGVQGYVKVAYLVFEKPARLIVAEVQSENERLQREIEENKAAFAEPAATIDQLRTELSDTQSQLEDQRSEAESLAEENQKYRKRHDQFKFSLPVSWVLAAMGICLVVGILAGLWWIDNRSRKRHGGIRIY